MPNGLLEQCVVCAARIPLRLPSAGESGLDWECVGCGTLYHAVLCEDADPELRKSLRQLKDKDAIAAEKLTRELLPQGVAQSCIPQVLGVRCRTESDLSRRLDIDVDTGAALRTYAQDEPFSSRVTRHGAAPYSRAIVEQFFQAHQVNASKIGALFSSLDTGSNTSLDASEIIARELMDQFAEDQDLCVSFGLNLATGGDYPSYHSLRVSMLAMAVGAQLGLDQRNLLDLTKGCLLHDLGMQRVRDLRFDTNRMFGLNEYMEVAAHPLHTFELLRTNLDHVSPSSRMVAYQIHERNNGAGYPRGRKSSQIHDLAKIAAVADTYVALVSKRPHRDGLIPYFAIDKIIRDTREGLFDPTAVRGLLQTVSLFPVGSYVAIGDELIGRVLRSNPTAYDQPVVEVWARHRPNADPVVIDLSQQQRTPLRPMSPPPFGLRRS